MPSALERPSNPFACFAPSPAQVLSKGSHHRCGSGKFPPSNLKTLCLIKDARKTNLLVSRRMRHSPQPLANRFYPWHLILTSNAYLT